MARPSKPVSTLEGHRTKRELASRRRAEEQMLSGKRLSASADVKADQIAAAEFRRVKKLMAAIGKDDALYGAQINRYCMLRSEELGLQARAERVTDMLGSCNDPKDAANLARSLADIDRLTTQKRKLMESIERENCMTVQAALRSIPKKPEEKKNPLLEALNADMGNGGV